ncbi:glycine decarboxylase subunit P, partial [Steccherinum ochraceum]
MSSSRCVSLISRQAFSKQSHARSYLASKVIARYLATQKAPRSPLAALDTFPNRHIGPDDKELSHMLGQLGYESMQAFVADTVPPKIRVASTSVDDSSIPALSEAELNQRARELAHTNKAFTSYIGMGYHNAVVPPVILRNIMESPAWYTPYTPYQPEIAQGRLESLVNYQTMIMSMTAMDIANASLLDEATAAAEGMVLSYVSSNQKKRSFFVDRGVLPQTLDVLKTRAKGFGIRLVVGDVFADLKDESLRADLCGVLVQYPNVDGSVADYASVAEYAHSNGALVVAATDLLALTMLKPPGEWGADVVVGNSARFGVPAGYGGPHGAFFACTEKLKRKMPGRLIGRSRDVEGKPAYRLALQTREQHIRREKATSNICTAQALLANMAAMYAVYHGPTGLKRIATKVHLLTNTLKTSVEQLGFKITNPEFFDTLTIDVTGAVADAGVLELRHPRRPPTHLRVPPAPRLQLAPLRDRDDALNSTSSMVPLTWPEFGAVHPFVPKDQVEGYAQIIKELEDDLCKITGFHACSLQPNSGAAGEYAGLSVIRAYHESQGEGHRDICLIPVSAHGTNPASAVMAGLKVVPVKTLADGSLDLVDLKAKAEKHKDNLAAFMITYPSTFGVFEDGVQDACQIIHDNGGQVYLDGANLNAQIGLTNPATC